MPLAKVICAVWIAQSVWLGVPISAARGRPLIAQAGPASGLVDQGVRDYLEGRYSQARDLLEQALADKTLDTNRRLGALYYLACCQIALDDVPAAQHVFKSLLDLKPDYLLPAGTAPKIVRVFEKVKAQARTSPRIDKHLQTGPKPPANPALAKAGENPPVKKAPEKHHGSTWWIWVLAGAVVAGVAVGLGVGLSGGGTDRGRAIVTIGVQ